MIYTDCFSFFPRKILSDLNTSRATTKKVQYSPSLISDKVCFLFCFYHPGFLYQATCALHERGFLISSLTLLHKIKSQLIQTGDRELLSRVFTAYKNLVTTNPGVFLKYCEFQVGF